MKIFIFLFQTRRYIYHQTYRCFILHLRTRCQLNSHHALKWWKWIHFTHILWLFSQLEEKEERKKNYLRGNVVKLPLDWYVAYRQFSSLAQSCPTLCDPMDRRPPGSSIHGILQARILEWVAIPFSRGSSRPRDRTQVSHIAGRHFNLWAIREAHCFKKNCATDDWIYISNTINRMSKSYVVIL